LVAVVALVASGSARAGEIRVAVASNFSFAARQLEDAFEARTEHDVKLAFGSTGKHYAQILNGAPVDVLLAADERRPRLLEEDGQCVAGSRFTYARGRLVLWSPRAGYVDRQGRVLEAGDFRHLALANPRLAPYGAAAREVLEALGHWKSLGKRIVRGENIAQALQFVDSGNAELGFIAAAQLTPERRANGSWWEVPEELYTPIDQQAVLLEDTPAAREFMAFLGSGEAKELIRQNGYQVP
jgi:molybdate transport system substrate-binding protein